MKSQQKSSSQLIWKLKAIPTIIPISLYLSDMMMSHCVKQQGQALTSYDKPKKKSPHFYGNCMEDAESSQSKLTQSTPRKKKIFFFFSIYFLSFSTLWKKNQSITSWKEKNQKSNFQKKEGRKNILEPIKDKISSFFSSPKSQIFNSKFSFSSLEFHILNARF